MSKTNNLTAGQALEILESAINYCQGAGVPAGVAKFHDTGRVGVVIVLDNVDLWPDGHLHPIASTGKGESEVQL